jgi:peptide deformylase
MSRFTMAAMALAMGAFDTPMPDDGEDPLVRHNDPILQQRCEPATAADVKEFARLARRVFELHRNGVGLAAPQVGIARRVIALRPYKSVQADILINPTIVSLGPRLETAQEGCLSYPGIYRDVERSWSVRVLCTGLDGKRRERTYTSFEARIVQHEMDHLDGRCIVGMGPVVDLVKEVQNG